VPNAVVSVTVPVSEWGRRLGDALRATLVQGDFARAVQFVRNGDGQARSLAREYTLMVRGLGVTVRLLWSLLQETVARADAASVASAAQFMHAFRGSLQGAVHPVWGDVGFEVQPATSTLEQEIAAAGDLLAACEARCDLEQQRLADTILRAIEACDAPQALALLRSKEQDHYLRFHDALVRSMADTFGWVQRRFGQDELLRFHLATAQAQRSGIEKWERMTPAEFAHASAFLFKLHMGALEVSEDAEKFTFDQSLCGSGGRLRLSGAYEGTHALPFVDGPGPLTFGQPRLPVYCSHCAVWNGVAPLRWFGRAHWVFEDPARADGGCRLHIYKRREDSPDAYRRMLAPAAWPEAAGSDSTPS